MSKLIVALAWLVFVSPLVVPIAEQEAKAAIAMYPRAAGVWATIEAKAFSYPALCRLRGPCRRPHKR